MRPRRLIESWFFDLEASKEKNDNDCSQVEHRSAVFGQRLVQHSEVSSQVHEGSSEADVSMLESDRDRDTLNVVKTVHWKLFGRSTLAKPLLSRLA